ncbi:hypothetical protein [Myxacorys almedinensis]|uniref:Tyr recombinase domain-containing protein n=1 Tax=Myxacorys almedinensis A TaxID=2690445 RepID=A0A8J7Z266_9CYAN|nr:hypothetical protein [Myxacorys almedinensis]NDJ16778.1 hypothetical protein [Myxacorys almedinensis A]
MQLPPIKLNRPNIDVGHSATRYFRGFGLPFHLYDLRHAYAIRATLTYGMDYKLVAKMMGHSYGVHESIYHRWLNLDVVQAVYDAAINRRDRVPPL